MASVFTFQFLPASIQTLDERYAWFDRMRRSAPVFFDEETQKWHVFRYDDVLTVLTTVSDYSSELKRGSKNTSSLLAPTMIAHDPPYHRKLRGLVSQAFTPRVLARLEKRLEALVQELLDAMREQEGSVDFVKAFSYPLPSTVISELLGVPVSDRQQLKQLTEALANDTDTVIGEEGILAGQQRSQQAQQQFSEYILALMKERRQHPTDDLLTLLIQARVDGEYLSEDELVGFCFLLWGAGHETTTNLLGSSVLCFDTFPEAARLIRENAELAPTVIEEVLRYRSPIWGLNRRTTTTVHLGGKEIPEGEFVRIWFSSANRDEEQFPQAHTFLPLRTPNKHIAFGHGIHFCLGAPLARLEAKIALPMLLRQFPRLQVDKNRVVEMSDNPTICGPRFLPVVF